jgi:hypothetical protein
LKQRLSNEIRDCVGCSCLLKRNTKGSRSGTRKITLDGNMIIQEGMQRSGKGKHWVKHNEYQLLLTTIIMFCGIKNMQSKTYDNINNSQNRESGYLGLFRLL